ncbi:MAG: hypothetical protein ACE5GA_05600 [Candidatus Zixiibacteriota bacterium]
MNETIIKAYYAGRPAMLSVLAIAALTLFGAPGLIHAASVCPDSVSGSHCNPVRYTVNPDTALNSADLTFSAVSDGLGSVEVGADGRVIYLPHRLDALNPLSITVSGVSGDDTLFQCVTAVTVTNSMES